MKKFFLSILTFLYLMLSTGFSIELHYCMGSIASIDIVSNGDNMCSKCGMKEKKGGCCRDEVRFYKFEKSFKASNFIYVTQQLSESEPAVFQYFDISVYSHPDHSCYAVISNSTYPSGPPIYLRNRVFRL